jgi:peptidoglycan hydrolase FlgJ
MTTLPIYNKRPPLPAPGAAAKDGADEERLKKCATDFESILVNQLLKFMRQTVVPSGFLGQSPGKAIYDSLFDQELSQSIAKRSSLGLGKIIYNQLAKKISSRNSSP